MRPGRPLVALLLGSLLAVTLAAAAAAQGPGASAGAVAPAPPPGDYCRVRPAETWPAFESSLPPPDLTPFQDYRAGLGIDGTARGTGVTIADVEYEWRATHEELAARGLPPAPASGLAPGWRAEDHGTAVLGVIGGSEDGRGVSGLAPEASIVPVSPATSPYRPWVEAAATAATLGPGDVMLIELQAGLGARGAGPYAPIEVYAPMRDAIRAAVERGVVVVEPAGNSARDIAEILDATGTSAPWLLGPEAEGHTGALIVAGGGAGVDASGTPDLRRVGGSNFGARVDLQGYGAGVVTAGYGDVPWSPAGDRAYTACFDGTSSAAATVAGAVAALQGAAVARTGAPLAPAEVRELLVATGTPQADAVADGPIGPRPDVAAAIAALPEPEVSPPPPPADGRSEGARAPTAPAPAPAPPPQPAGPAQPAPPAVSVAVPVLRRAAARRVVVRVDRRARTMMLRFRGLAPRARVFARGRRVGVRSGRAVLRRIPRRALLVRVSAPARAGRTYRTSVFRVRIPARGPVRAVRVR